MKSTNYLVLWAYSINMHLFTEPYFYDIGNIFTNHVFFRLKKQAHHWEMCNESDGEEQVYAEYKCIFTFNMEQIGQKAVSLPFTLGLISRIGKGDP